MKKRLLSYSTQILLTIFTHTNCYPNINLFKKIINMVKPNLLPYQKTFLLVLNWVTVTIVHPPISHIFPHKYISILVIIWFIVHQRPLTPTEGLILFFFSSFQVYCLLCVISQYQEYKAGRGGAPHNLLSCVSIENVEANCNFKAPLLIFFCNKKIWLYFYCHAERCVCVK